LAYDLYHGFSIQILLKEIAFITPENLIEQRKRNYQEKNARPVIKLTFRGIFYFSRRKHRILLIPAKIFIKILGVLRQRVGKGILFAGRRNEDFFGSRRADSGQNILPCGIARLKTGKGL